MFYPEEIELPAKGRLARMFYPEEIELSAKGRLTRMFYFEEIELPAKGMFYPGKIIWPAKGRLVGYCTLERLNCQLCKGRAAGILYLGGIELPANGRAAGILYWNNSNEKDTPYGLKSRGVSILQEKIGDVFLVLQIFCKQIFYSFAEL